MTELIFEPYTVSLRFHSQTSKAADTWAQLLCNFMNHIEGRIADRDAVMIGHLKGIAWTTGSGFLKISAVRAGHSADIGKVVIGTVTGDIHDIGKDLVVGLLEANNFEVYDVGAVQSKEVLIVKIKETGAKVVGLSGLLTIAFDAMKDTVAALEAEGLRDKVKVMIGGGPINQGVCDYVGADQ